MTDLPVRSIRDALRGALTILTIGAVLWAFVWVLYRPWRKAAAHGGRVELVLMHWGNKDESEIVDGLIADFRKLHPEIAIHRVNPGGDLYHTKLQTMMAGGCPPDVFYVGSDRFPGLAAKGQLLDLEALMEADVAAGRPDLLNDFYPQVLDAFRFDGRKVGPGGRAFGVPKDFTTVGFYYNRDLFHRAGVPEPADDWTWDDWLSAATAVARLGPDYYGCELVQWPAMIRAFLWTQGVDIATADFSRVPADDPALITALERMRAWRYDPPTPRLLTRGVFSGITSSDAFLTGKAGMNGPLGRWMTPTLRGIDQFDWDFAPLPRERGRPPANGIFTTAWGISPKTRDQRAAWELVRFLSGSPGQTQISRQGLAIPALRSVAESPAFKDPTLKPLRNDAFLVSIPYARPVDWPAYPEFESLVDSYLSRALNLEQGSVPDALSEFQQMWARHQSAPLRQTNYPLMSWGAIATWVGIPVLVLCGIGIVVWYRTRPPQMEFREELAGMGLVSPWILGFLLFTLFPIGLSLLLAFTKWNGVDTLDHAQFVGLDNLKQQVFHDERFRTSIWATAYYALLAVPLSQLAALAAALLMNQNVRGITFFRAAWYLPSVLAGVGVAVLWRWVFDYQAGLLNLALQPFTNGINWLGNWLFPLADAGKWAVRPPQWFGDDAPTWAVPAFAIMGLWTIGGSMMIYLAGLKGIPPDLKEAAAIDGATPTQRFWHVTLPMLSPVVFFNFIMAIIASFQVFVQSYVMTGGGPGDVTRFFVLYIYNQAFDFHEMGYASMMAWMLLVITLGLTLIVMRGSRRFVYYEGLKS